MPQLPPPGPTYDWVGQRAQLATNEALAATALATARGVVTTQTAAIVSAYQAISAAVVAINATAAAHAAARLLANDLRVQLGFGGAEPATCKANSYEGALLPEARATVNTAIKAAVAGGALPALHDWTRDLAMTSLADLMTAPVAADVETNLLYLLQAAGLPVTQWQSGGVARTIVKTFIAGIIDLYSTVAQIAAGGFNATATGPWLDLLSASAYQNDRFLATPASGTVTLASVTDAPTYSIVPKQLLFAWPPTGQKYRNTTGGVLVPGGTLGVTWQAESPGAAWNAPTNGVSALAVTLAGVSITGSSTDVLGTDDETDDGLRARNAGKWGASGAAGNDAGYLGWARAASAQVTRVAVADNAPIDGQVTVVVAGPTGTAPSSAVAAVDAYIGARRACGVRVFTVPATERLVKVTGKITVASGTADVLGRAITSIAAYINGLPLAAAAGGEGVPGGVTVSRVQIEAAIASPFPKNTTFPFVVLPVKDFDLAAYEVATFDASGLTVEYSP